MRIILLKYNIYKSRVGDSEGVGKFRNKYWNRIELLKKWFGIEPEFEFIFYNVKMCTYSIICGKKIKS